MAASRLATLRASTRAIRGLQITVRPLSTAPPPPRTNTGIALALGLGLGLGGAYALGLAQTAAADASTSPIVPVSSSKAKDRSAARFGTPDDYAAAIASLQSHFPAEDISIDEDDRLLHAQNENVWAEAHMPSCVVYPRSTEDVQLILRTASKYRVPVVPYGGGTSLEGHYNATFGGICVNLAMNMDKVLAVHPEDGDMVVQAGISYDTINAELEKRGLAFFLPLDPGPSATIGGMISTGCSGTNSVRYGTARAEWFLNVTAVLPDGSVVKTRQRARKSSTGPDMTKLFIGAEGTLGIVTEVTIRLAPRPPTRVAVAGFPSVRDAVSAVVDILGEGVIVQCAELMDKQHIEAVNEGGVMSKPLPVQDTILFKLQGNDEQVKESGRIVTEIVKRHGGGDLLLTKDDKEGDDIWAARRGAVFAAMAHSGYENPLVYANDICVPVSRLPDLITEAKKRLDAEGFYAPAFGHVGDGNLHLNLILRSKDEVPAAREVMSGIITHAITELDGTCTGEHGVGMTKKKYLTLELGEGTVSLMRSIKDTIDPLGIMNPGKLYPDEPDDAAEEWPPAPNRCC